MQLAEGNDRMGSMTPDASRAIPEASLLLFPRWTGERKATKTCGRCDGRGTVGIREVCPRCKGVGSEPVR